jgi:hypothetical protein
MPLGRSVTAEVSSVTVGIGLGGGTINGASDSSSYTVRGNQIGATAIGNSGVNRITAD